MDAGFKPKSKSNFNFCSIFSSPVSFSPATPVLFPEPDINDAVLDSGCTLHTYPDEAPGYNKISTPPSLATKCRIPNGHHMIQTHTATLPIVDMPHNAKVLKIYSEHSYKPLLSLDTILTTSL